jgi:hypothetical protein
MEKGQIITSQIRFAPDLHEYIKSNSQRLGVSQNAFATILMDLGRRAYEGRENRRNPWNSYQE